MNALRTSLRRRARAAGKHLAAAIASLRSPTAMDQRLETLTPALLDPAHSNRYEHEMVAAMADPHIRNIGITGGYGSGKSSLIRTFKENNPHFKYAAVSLATFRKDGVINESAGDLASRVDELQGSNQIMLTPEQIVALVERIEETIVQQLLYAVPASKLPRTRLKRITQPSNARSWGVTLALSLAVVACAHLFLVTRAKPLTQGAQWLADKLSWIPIPWAITVTCAVGACALYQIVRSLSLLNIDGWSIKGGTIESMQHSSVLHKNVDELLYCFQNSDIDVVVIEDLDRFGIQDVFFRLREINAIINESPQIKRTVRFIYALNDELFAGSDKAKFFDLILPVVPVINKENSHAKMIELLAARSLKGRALLAGIDEELVETVSYRIDDMRLIKNIVNELDVFAEILTREIPLPLSKIFAMIVVKNLHSEQYWQLAKRTGFLYRLISGYASWRSIRADALRSDIAEMEQLIVQKNKEVARSRRELRLLAWYAAQGQVSGATHIRMQHTHYTLDQFLDDDVFDSLSKAKNLYFLRDSNHLGGAFSLSSTLVEMDYERRYCAIEASDTELQSGILSKQAQLRDLQKLPLSQALLDGYQDDYAAELAQHETIRYLLVAGHLDEDYADYLGHFYGHAIGREDMNLIFTLRQGEDCGVDAKIKDPEKFLRKLRLRNIDRGRGISAELLLYLAQAHKNGARLPHGEFLERIFEDVDAHLVRFAEAFDILVQQQDEEALVQAIYELRPTIISSVLSGSADSADPPRTSRVVAVLKALQANQLKSIDAMDSGFKRRIESTPDASLLVSGVTRENGAWAWMKSSGLRFHNLATNTSPEVISVLMEQDTLAAILPVLKLVALNGKPVEQIDPPVTLSRLYAADRIPPVRRFVSDHLVEIVRELINQKTTLAEETDVAITALKSIQDHVDLTLQFFEATTCKFPTLGDLAPHLWNSAMRGDRVEERAGAVRSYIEHRVDWAIEPSEDEEQIIARSVLADYANTHAKAIAEECWAGTDSDELLQEWIVREGELTDDAVLALLGKTIITSAAVLDESASDERIQLLASNGHLAAHDDIWEVIQNREIEAKASYLGSVWSQFRLVANEPELDLQVALRLYQGDILTIEEALRIFAEMDQTELAVERELMGSLAHRALANKQALSLPLMEVAKQILQTEDTHQPWTISLLVAAMPAMGWPAVAHVLHTIGGDLIKLSEAKSAEIIPIDELEPLLDALKRHGFASTLTPGRKGKTRVNMKKNLS